MARSQYAVGRTRTRFHSDGQCRRFRVLPAGWVLSVPAALRTEADLSALTPRAALTTAAPHHHYSAHKAAATATTGCFSSDWSRY